MKYLIFLFLGLLAQIAIAQPLQVSFGDLTARSIGPAVMSGRVSDVIGVNSDPKTIYIGAANGGVWKSIDAGASFQSIFDDNNLSIGQIAVDQKYPDTIWVGTGEPWTRNSTSVGTGIYVSTNAGKNWQFKGLKDSERISGLIIHPQNSAVLYAAAQGHLWGANEERGLYKTTNFGKTWERILFVDENTGCADVTMDMQNPDVLYATMWEHRRYPDFFNSGGKGSGLYKTTDGGKTWAKLTNGLPQGILGRIGVAVAPSNSNIVYASIESEAKDGKGLYRSDDAGGTWKKMSGDFNTTVRPFYFSRIVVDPNNANKIYKAGLEMVVSEDGGNSFRSIYSGVHSDMHDAWIDPTNSERVYIGTDGGAYRSLDGGKQFEMFMNLPLSQFYHVTVDNADPFNLYGGLQDNGSWYGPSSSAGGIENKDWQIVNWGDGFRVYPHRTDANIVYAESQGGELVRYDKRDGQRKSIKPLNGKGEPEYRFNWNSPIQLSPTHPERLYYGAQFLFMSLDRGDSWTKISPDLTTNDPQRQRQKKSGGLSIDNSTAENNTTIYAIAESAKDEQVIWVGTDDGNLQMTENAGKSWTNVAGNIPNLPKGLWISHIEPSKFDRNTCYVTIDGHNSGDNKPYIYKTSDLGKTWQSLVTADLEGFAHALVEDTQSANLLFLGTEFGLYISLDGGKAWKRFDKGIPAKISVRMMALQARTSALAIATHGRGLYIIDDISLLRELTPAIINEELAFFTAKPGYIRFGQLSEPFGGAGNFYGENPNTGPKIAYYMRKRHTFGKMTMELYDDKGNFIKELPAGKSAGINIVSIPIYLPMPKSAPTKNRMALGGTLSPPTLPEGSYTIKITKGDKEYATNFTLNADPKTLYPLVERQLSHATQMKLYSMTEQLAYIYDGLTTMHTEVAKRNEGTKNKKWKETLKTFATETEKLKSSLVSLEGDFYIDESSNLREEISTLALNVSFFPGKPSASQLAKTEELNETLQEVQRQFDGFKQQLTTINTYLQKSGLPIVEIITFEAFKAK